MQSMKSEPNLTLVRQIVIRVQHYFFNPNFKSQELSFKNNCLRIFCKNEVISS